MKFKDELKKISVNIQKDFKELKELVNQEKPCEKGGKKGFNSSMEKQTQ